MQKEQIARINSLEKMVNAEMIDSQSIEEQVSLDDIRAEANKARNLWEMMSRISPALRQLSRNNLLAFSKATMPDYEIGWVHKEICAKLMEFYIRVKEKDSPRLILTMPPRHGKSQLSSINFPSWCFGVDPNIHFINASYSHNLAESMNRG